MRFIHGSLTRVTVALAVLGWAWYGAVEAESGSIEDRMADRRVVHVGPTKVHIDTQFTRYREDGSVIATYESLYIVTLEDGRWGVKMRSSFAG